MKNSQKLPKQIKLQENEKLIFVIKPSILFTLRGFVLSAPLVIAVDIFILIKNPAPGVIILLLYGLLFLIYYLRWKSIYFIVTDKKIIWLQGILKKSFISIKLQNIQDIRIKQTFLQKVMKCGTIIFTTAGTSGLEMLWENVPNPWEFYRKLNEFLTDYIAPK